MSGVPKAVPSAIAPSTQNSVPVLTEPQLGPHYPMTGSQRIKNVPRAQGDDPEKLSQPYFSGGGSLTGGPNESGSAGAPSVPVDGFLFRAPPIDIHYQNVVEGNPYHRVNSPPTRGMWTRLQDFTNGIGLGSQNKTNTGWNNREAQQRTSFMRNQLPNLGIGYIGGEQFTPHQLPQTPHTQKFIPVVGTQPSGTGVLNMDTFGAGQTAGGVGGNNFSPSPSPPVTTSTAGQNSNPSGMPTWG